MVSLSSLVEKMLSDRGLSTAELSAQIGLKTGDSVLADIALYDEELTINLNAIHATSVATVLGEELWKALEICCPSCGTYGLAVNRDVASVVRRLMRQHRE